ncbi:hypothetical protein BDA96_01G197800 [Sorghum bicolor]|uniref:Reverse transcriptase domain-containing protein n=1 Tax=Sorghum bicolor TaxID=4558 RepID=A0A921RZ08_SORBI|nr:hypothetical protein BDA96_01G197800 [Sorghum bicolor]
MSCPFGHKEPKKFAFDITKADRIFDFLLQEGQIKLSPNDVIPSVESRENRRQSVRQPQLPSWCPEGLTRTQKKKAAAGATRRQDTKGKGPSANVNMVFMLPMEFLAPFSDDNEVDCPDEIAQLALDPMTAIFEKLDDNERQHLNALFVKGKVDGQPMTKILVDGGAAINIMPYAVYQKLGKGDQDLTKTDMMLKDFEGNVSPVKGAICVELTIGNKTLPTTFFVISGKGAYNLLFTDDGKLGQVFTSANDLAEVDIGNGDRPRPTFINAKLDSKCKQQLTDLNLNNATPMDGFPMIVANLLVDAAAGHRIISFMDGNAGYNQIFMAEEDIPKTAFRCPGHVGLFEWIVMTFGLKNAGATYQRAMNFIFHEFIGKLVEIYIDDVVVKSGNFIKHLADLRKVLECTRKHGLKMNPNKCAFGVLAGKFLGFMVHQRGIEISRRYIDAINKIVAPTNKIELQPLIADQEFVWGKEQQSALDEIKNYLTNPPVLIPPQQGKPFKLHYLLSAECTIICKDDVVRYMLCMLIINGRIGKWILALSEFDLHYESAKAHCGVVGTLEIVPWTLFFDGSMCDRGAGIGIVLISPRGKKYEFSLLIVAIEVLITYYENSIQLLREFKDFRLEHVPRLQNELANRLAQHASGYQLILNLLSAISADDWRKELIDYLKDPSKKVERHSAFKMKWMIRRNGYYWPTILEDCFKYFKGSIDLIGQIYPPSSKGHKFILVATDYFTKWVEAIPLKKVTSANMIDFVKEHIGTMFRSGEFDEFAIVNGQAEASNKGIIKLIKRKIEENPRRWHTLLSEALWSYRMACHGSTKVSPY